MKSPAGCHILKILTKGPCLANNPDSVGPLHFSSQYLFTQQQVNLCTLDTGVAKEQQYFIIIFPGGDIAVMYAY